MTFARPACDREWPQRGALHLCARALASLLMLAACAAGARAQTEVPILTELLAVRRVMPDEGPGLRSVCRGPGGNYYVLSAPGTAVLIYDASGKRIGQVPANPVGPAAIVYGESLSVDAAGRVAVADRGADGVKVYAADGSLAVFIRAASPESVAFLEVSEGSELAVASLSGDHLVKVYDISGRLVREFGDPNDVAEQPVPIHEASAGVIATDVSSDVYFAFDYLPEGTVLKYDRLGYALFDISFNIPEPHRVITGMGVDPENQDLWVSAGTLLLHFDKDGNRLASYRTYTPSGGRLESTTILVEADRLLLGADPFGLYEFARPDKVAH
jgi:hypothetical protein